MPSASPSPVKRPSIYHRTSSTHSLSSSGKQTATVKSHRPHVVSRHSRNVSHGKGLSKLGRVNSTHNVVNEARNHQRKKSAPETPLASPKLSVSTNMKRNSSHVVLTKNTSFGNLRKNQSATTLASNRNTSHGALKKLGAPPSQKLKDEHKQGGVFDLGGQSSEDEEEENEWEDSTQSPEMTRDNSKASTPVRVRTPNPEPRQKHPEPHPLATEKTSSPPAPSLRDKNRSAPNLRQDNIFTQEPQPKDPAILQQNGRASRAPPAMSTVSAHAKAAQVTRTESTRSFTHVTHQDAESQPGSTSASGPSSGSVGVSHFLPTIVSRHSQEGVDEGSDDDSPFGFMSNYKPQPSESPEKIKSQLNKTKSLHVPSRTQQRLELQRIETMRGTGTTPTTPQAPSMGLSVGSSVSLHSRSGSKGRNRSIAGELKALKQDYDTTIRLLTIVRRFRNPILDSLNRLKEAEVLPAEIGVQSNSGGAKSRPQSRRGLSHQPGMNGATRTLVSSSPEDRKSVAPFHPSMKPRSGRVSFQLSRQGSHDNMMTTSQGSPDGEDELQDGMTREESMIRRMWESRIIYEPDGAHAAS